MSGVYETHFQFEGQTGFRRGKVRDIYEIAGAYLVMVTTDRISAYDVILSDTIPHKGQVLTGITEHMYQKLSDICPTAWVSTPDPQVMIVRRARVFPVEVIVRRCLVGYVWRLYRTGGRLISGVRLPEGLIENDLLPEPILTPTTKSVIGHDVEISEREIVESGLVPAPQWEKIRTYALRLFTRGIEMAERGGMLLCDAKYEFAELDGEVVLVDEVHTPDSARYLLLEGYEERQRRADPQIHMTKEYVREWLMRQGFQGQPNATPPPLPDSLVSEVVARYREVYERLVGKPFSPRSYENILETMYERVARALAAL